MVILPKGPRSLGESVGQGLGSGIENLANLKLQHVLERIQSGKQAQGFQKAGLPAGLEDLPQQVQAAYVKNYFKQPSERAFGDATNILDQLGSNENQFGSNQFGSNEFATQQNAGQQNSDFENNLSALLGINSPGDTLNAAGQLPDVKALMAAQQVAAQQVAAPQVAKPQVAKQLANEQEVQIPTTANYSLSNLSPEKKQMLNNALRQMSPAQRKEFESMRREKEKLFKEEQSGIDKEFKPLVTDIKTKAKAAKENSLRLDKMEQLIKTKNLSRPRFAALINTLKKGVFGLGADFSSLLTPESQEFEKTSQDFLKNIKDVFGARILETEIENYMKTIPTLSMNREGKYRVINDLRLMNEAAMAKDKALDQIRIKNNGHLPRNADILVEQIAKPKLDEIAAKFKQGWQRPVKAPKEKGIFDAITGGVKTLSPNSLLNSLFGKG
jgi:hypothetical protein